MNAQSMNGFDHGVAQIVIDLPSARDAGTLVFASTTI
jgi:hypothetical protein